MCKVGTLESLRPDQKPKIRAGAGKTHPAEARRSEVSGGAGKVVVDANMTDKSVKVPDTDERGGKVVEEAHRSRCSCRYRCVSDATKHLCRVWGGLHGNLNKTWVEVDAIFGYKWTIA